MPFENFFAQTAILIFIFSIRAQQKKFNRKSVSRAATRNVHLGVSLTRNSNLSKAITAFDKKDVQTGHLKIYFAVRLAH